MQKHVMWLLTLLVFCVCLQAGDWHVFYSPDQRVSPANLYQAMKASQHQRLQLYVQQVEPSSSTTSRAADSSSYPAAAAGFSAQQSVQSTAPAEQTQPVPQTHTALPALEQVLRDLSRHINRAFTTNASSSNMSNSSSSSPPVVNAPAAGAAMAPAREANGTAIHLAVPSATQQPSNAAESSHCSQYARRGACITTQAGIEELTTGLAKVAEATVTAAAAAAVATTMLIAGAQQAAAALAAW
jgi:hypothetical protein